MERKKLGMPVNDYFEKLGFTEHPTLSDGIKIFQKGVGKEKLVWVVTDEGEFISGHNIRGPKHFNQTIDQIHANVLNFHEKKEMGIDDQTRLRIQNEKLLELSLKTSGNLRYQSIGFVEKT